MSEEVIEIWKDIPGYEGLYQVSSLGRVKIFPKSLYITRGRLSKRKVRFLKPNPINGGYLQICFTKDNKEKRFTVHQLVAMAFLGHVPKGRYFVVDHINNVRTDNRLENLQIISQRENASKDRKGYTSEYIGVCWNKRNNNWVSKIATGKETIHLGSHNNEIEASEMYQKALKNLHLYEGNAKEFREKLNGLY